VSRSLLFASLTIAAVLAAPLARAQAEAPTAQADGALTDAVEMKNGAYLRGLILEVDPSSHLTLKLPTGEIRKIPVSEIAAAERSGKPLKFVESQAAEAPKPKAPVSPEAQPSQRELDRLLAQIPGPRVKLTLEANTDAFLERRIGSGTSNYVAYHFVCPVPCAVDLPANDPVPYRLDGERTEPTEWFQLPRYNARIKGDLVSNMWPIWPRAMLVGGVIFSLVGGGMLAGWALADGSDGVRNVGIGLAAAGGVFFLTSGVLFLARPHSSYEIERAP
jgi:hypothetical protein